ncbi:MAG TPA: hypothetical protein VGP15_20455 [Burkholderiales bacterium]|jgi:hypothetical protein|nr:hypothetical protein [Burkholderiales bacterium]
MSRLHLTPDEIHSLRQLTRGSVRARINSADAALLVERGYARETADGVAITQLGRSVLAAIDGSLRDVTRVTGTQARARARARP